MCFQVYLGSAVECPEIPYVNHEDGQSLFPNPEDRKLFAYKHPEHDGLRVMITGLSLPYQYHLGIMPCGCGFAYDFPPMEDYDIDAQRQLVDYVAPCLERSQPIELMSFWNGDHAAPIEHYRQITLQGLSKRWFYFEERQLTVVYKDVESLHAGLQKVGFKQKTVDTTSTHQLVIDEDSQLKLKRIDHR
jgi:hypothetical protein